MAGRPVAVLDTNVLLNLATPVVDGRDRAPTGDDPLKAVLSTYDVRVPARVVGEVTAASDGDDLLAAAADLVLKASRHLRTRDVGSEIDGELDYGLDEGEARAIWLANKLEAPLFVTDEFGSTTYLLVSLALDDANSLFTTPHVLCRLTDEGVLGEAYTAAVLAYLCDLKHWDRQYVDCLRSKYL